MNILQKLCAVFILTAITSFSISAQDDKKPPGKDHTPKVRVEKDKVEDKQPDKGRDKGERDNKDKGNKKPGVR